MAGNNMQHMKAGTATVTIADSGIYNATMTGTMVFRRSPALVVAENLTISAGGKSTTVKMIITGTAVYLSEPSLASQVGKPWLKLELSALNTPALASIGQLVHSLQSNNFLDETQIFAADKNVRAVGSQTLDGVPTTEYAGTFQANKLAAALAPAVRKVLGPSLQLLGTSSVSFDMWIDKQYEVRKMTEFVTTSGGLAVNTDVTVTGINQPVQITLPPASETATPPGS